MPEGRPNTLSCACWQVDHWRLRRMEHSSRLQALTQQLRGLQDNLGALEERARYGAARKREAEANLHKLSGELRTMQAGYGARCLTTA